jgi:hypothetical protein
MKVLPINAYEAEPWLLEKHYAKRLPMIMYAFGLYEDDNLIGVVTYGLPGSPMVARGICGKEHSTIVIELNRLCLLNNDKNQASFLVANSMKLLPKPTIVISYADTGHGHVGYVYQACNFIYLGLSFKFFNWNVKGKENVHNRHLAQGMTLELMKEKYGDDFYYSERPRKHRYIFICGNKYQKKQLVALLKYEIQPYPKGETARYDSGTSVKTQQLLFV